MNRHLCSRRAVIDRRAIAALTLVALGAMAWAAGLVTGAQAQSADTIRQHDRELQSVRSEQKQSRETEDRLKAEIAAIGEDRRKLNQSLIDTAARLQGVEARITATEERLRELARSEDRLRTSLAGRRKVIAEVLAALQRMGRRPPPVLLVRPEDALEAVRTAMMLGAVLPDMRAETEALAANLAELVRVRADSERERESLGRDVAALADDKARMTALVEERQKRQREAEQALDNERQRAQALARQANSLADLIAKLEQGLDSDSRAARRSEPPAGGGRDDLAALKDPGRLAPAVAFATAKGLLRLPVNGVKLRAFGEDGPTGAEKGLSIATRVGAQVTAPCDGWVMYAAPYRSYGQLLILNAGGGYHVLLAGMERISVEIGQFVLTGEPVAAMGAGPQTASVATAGLSAPSQPVLYIEFRKDGSPVDPTPWWATTDSEKVRG